MAAAGHEDIITILLVSKFKQNEPSWAYCTEYISLKSPERLSGTHKSSENCCKNEQKSMNLGLIGFQ